MADARATILNEAMKTERSTALRDSPGERLLDCLGDAEGFRPRRLLSRAGTLDLRIPKVRSLSDGPALEFCPKSLEQGLRSQRALKPAIAEKYRKGLSMRKVIAVTQQLGGLDVTSSQVSEATVEHDEVFETCRR